MDKPKCWVKTVIKKMYSWKWKFSPNIWVCPYLTQIWVQTTQHCLECKDKCLLKAISSYVTFSPTIIKGRVGIFVIQVETLHLLLAINNRCKCTIEVSGSKTCHPVIAFSPNTVIWCPTCLSTCI